MTKSVKYNDNFYLDQMDESRTSAKEIIPLLFDLYNIRSVVDIGCGTGSWLRAFKEAGVEDFYGIDGEYVNRELLQISKENFISGDLNNEFHNNFDRKFDLAMSLEVAEHIKFSNAKKFVDSLTSLSDVVMFSAAIPYQGGTGHINENWLEYWVSIFREYDYFPVDYLRDLIWDNQSVCWWYRQNILLFVRKDKFTELFPNVKPEESVIHSYVHPELFLWACARDKSNATQQYNLDLNYYRSLVKGDNLPNNGIEYNNRYDVDFNQKKLAFRIKKNLKKFLKR